MSSKKKTFKQDQIKFLFDIEWEYVRGEVPARYPKKGVTRVESVDEDSAKKEWINGVCLWGRRYKILSVTEVSDAEIPQPKKKKQHEKQTIRKSEPEHSAFDDIPDF